MKLNAPNPYFKYTHETLPNCFASFDLSTQSAHHSHDTRLRNQIRPNLIRTRYADNTLRNYLPVSINNTPRNIQQKMTTHSIHGFSSNIKELSQIIRSWMLYSKLLCLQWMMYQSTDMNHWTCPFQWCKHTVCTIARHYFSLMWCDLVSWFPC